jgi:uncharacterized alpha-E superfamily protein
MRLLSRNAESLFWLARYLERGASLARVIEMQSSFGGHDSTSGWSWLLALHSDEARFRERFEPTADSIIAFYLLDAANSGSIRSSIHWARENARALRPFIPTEMWGQLNTFHAMIEELDSDAIQRSELPRTCARIRAGCLAQIGIAEGTLYRDEAYQFFRLGLLIERADQTSRLLDVKFSQGATSARVADPAEDFVFWSTILRTAGAYQVFHRLEPESANPERVARFLVLSASHPRAIGFCAREIGDALQVLRSGFRLTKTSACLEACEVLAEGLQAAGQDKNLPVRLHEFNDWVQRTLMQLTREIGLAFFRAPQPEVDLPPEPVTADPPAASTSETPGHSQSQAQGQTQTQSQS